MGRLLKVGGAGDSLDSVVEEEAITAGGAVRGEALGICRLGMSIRFLRLDNACRTIDKKAIKRLRILAKTSLEGLNDPEGFMEDKESFGGVVFKDEALGAGVVVL